MHRTHQIRRTNTAMSLPLLCTHILIFQMFFSWLFPSFSFCRKDMEDFYWFFSFYFLIFFLLFRAWLIWIGNMKLFFVVNFVIIWSRETIGILNCLNSQRPRLNEKNFFGNFPKTFTYKSRSDLFFSIHKFFLPSWFFIFPLFTFPAVLVEFCLRSFWHTQRTALLLLIDRF